MVSDMASAQHTPLELEQGATIRALLESQTRLGTQLRETRQLIGVLVYWHDQDNGHIDESWWVEARKLALP